MALVVSVLALKICIAGSTLEGLPISKAVKADDVGKGLLRSV